MAAVARLVDTLLVLKKPSRPFRASESIASGVEGKGRIPFAQLLSLHLQWERTLNNG